MGPAELTSALRGLPVLDGVRLLVLHGSRARGGAGSGSDWDFGVLASGEADLAALSTALTLALGTDAVDVVDLARASALLRFRAARDGIVIAGSSDDFQHFQLAAVRYWCDAGPVIRAAQSDVLAALG